MKTETCCGLCRCDKRWLQSAEHGACWKGRTLKSDFTHCTTQTVLTPEVQCHEVIVVDYLPCTQSQLVFSWSPAVAHADLCSASSGFAHAPADTGRPARPVAAGCRESDSVKSNTRREFEITFDIFTSFEEFKDRSTFELLLPSEGDRVTTQEVNRLPLSFCVDYKYRRYFWSHLTHRCVQTIINAGHFPIINGPVWCSLIKKDTYFYKTVRDQINVIRLQT